MSAPDLRPIPPRVRVASVPQARAAPAFQKCQPPKPDSLWLGVPGPDLGGGGGRPVDTRNSFHKGNWKSHASLLPLAAKDHGGRNV